MLSVGDPRSPRIPRIPPKNDPLLQVTFPLPVMIDPPPDLPGTVHDLPFSAGQTGMRSILFTLIVR